MHNTCFKAALVFLFVFCLGALAQTATTALGAASTEAAAAAPTTSASVTPAAADSGEHYFVLGSVGWGPATGGRGEGSVGVRVGSGIYSLTSMNLAGGVGAVTEDVLYRAASARGVTLWARGGMGLTTTNSQSGTSTSPTFGGGVMVSYDLSRIKPTLAGLELFASCKIMYATTTVDGASTSTVRPMYQGGVKYSWQ